MNFLTASRSFLADSASSRWSNLSAKASFIRVSSRSQRAVMTAVPSTRPTATSGTQIDTPAMITSLPAAVRSAGDRVKRDSRDTSPAGALRLSEAECLL